MPVHDGGPYLRASIESILGQSFADFELLIVDDGSEDDSVAIARSFTDPRVRVVEQEHRGLVDTLNHGLATARGPLIARQDADDLSLPTRLDRQVAILASDPGLELLGGQAYVVDPRGRYKRTSVLPTETASVEWYQLFDNAFVHGSVMFRRQTACDSLGGYSRMLGEDFDMWSRMASVGELRNLADALVVRRVHPLSFQHSLDAGQLDRSHQANVTIIRRNAERTLGPGVVSASDVALMSRLRDGVRAGEYDRFVVLFDRLLEALIARRPEARLSRDLLSTQAAQYLQMVYSLRRQPLVAARPLLSAARKDLGTVVRLAGQLLGGWMGFRPGELRATMPRA